MTRALIRPDDDQTLSLREKTHQIQQFMGFNQTLLAGHLSLSSQKIYAHDFYHYLTFAQTKQAALDHATFAQWRNYLSTQTTISPHTINRMLSAVKRMMEMAEEQGFVPDGTAERFKRVRGVKAVALKERLRPHNRIKIEPEEIRQMTNEPDLERLIGLRDLAILHTFAGSGLRVSDLRQMRQDDIKRRGKGYFIEVRGKNEAEYDAVPLTREAYAAIMDWLTNRPVSSPYIFTGFAGRGERRLTDQPLSSRGVWLIIKGYARRVGLPEVKPHDLRRFVGTQLAKTNPRLAQRVLRHKSIETTYKYYVLDEIEPGATDGLY